MDITLADIALCAAGLALVGTIAFAEGKWPEEERSVESGDRDPIIGPSK